MQTQYTLIGSGVFSQADIEHHLDQQISEQTYIRIKQIAFECDNSDFLENILNMTEVKEALEAEAGSVPETETAAH
ncbi:hypothetical protein [Rothia sp. (in: high G+C Gram-positive bacteria)]|uniref:hypothetical protein n=1 Tax=Rothia sp. (in: high G+C Gram-positive bacteria) TaxID=1885016 RepID=UPI000EBA7B56|nr:hypothetical protein [Rothia sp. (in: high G+C Gram-positive bacteria)]